MNLPSQTSEINCVSKRFHHSNLAAIASLMTEPHLDFNYWLDFWLACPIEGVGSEAELRALYYRQKEVVQ